MATKSQIRKLKRRPTGPTKGRGYVRSSLSVWNRAENAAKTWADQPELILWLKENGLL